MTLFQNNYDDKYIEYLKELKSQLPKMIEILKEMI
jgi:hypothetical protein